jgi:hypothetical protein
VHQWIIGIHGLILSLKLTEFGAASPIPGMSKEDERTTALAARAQKGDYDEGRLPCYTDLGSGN